MKHIYYYMPPCPVCGSEITGRYVSTPYIKKDSMVIESLKKGEIVELKKRVPEKNAFCTSCGFQWKEEPRVVLINDDELDAEIARRKTELRLNDYIEQHHIDVDKKPLFGGIFSGLTNFF